MLPASYATYAAVLLATGGLLSCFGGYRLFRVVLGLFGFYAGALITSQFMDVSANTWALLLAALVGGLVGAGLMVAAYFLGVGLVGAGLAALGLNVAWNFVTGAEPPTLVLVIVCVVGALAALSAVRYVVIFGTAIAGAWTLIIGVLAMRGDDAAGKAASAGDVWILYPLDPLGARWWIVPAWLVLVISGVIVQLNMTGGGRSMQRRKKKRRKTQDADDD
jgi:hypothetical protein